VNCVGILLHQVSRVMHRMLSLWPFVAEPRSQGVIYKVTTSSIVVWWNKCACSIVLCEFVYALQHVVFTSSACQA
jgi:hypothetical protein